MRSLLTLAAALLASTAHADTLADALAAAYANNPDIAAQRAVVRQFDESVPQALSAARPQVSPNASYTQQLSSGFGDQGRLFQGGVTISQPLFRGGRTRASVSAGEQRIYAARARLRQAENQVLVNVVTAYADVLRTRELVKLNQNQVRVLETELRASRDRFEVGDLTRTDVAQSQARLSLAQANLVAARGQQVAAEQAYLRQVGRPPVNLQPIPALPPLPRDVPTAIDAARADSPSLLAARFDEGAARYDVRTIQGERLPTVSVSASGLYQDFSGGPGSAGPIGPGGGGGFGFSGFTPQIGASVSVPLFTGGNIGSRTRQAQARQSQLLETITSTDRAVVEGVTNSFEGVVTARGVRDAALVQIEATALAAEGTRQEQQVGSRTVIEVLNAEQELLNARTNLVQAERDLVVAGYSLLATMGRTEAVALGAPVEPYDPTYNARRVRALWGDGGGADPRTQRDANTARLRTAAR
jgi:outer membrane protein